MNALAVFFFVLLVMRPTGSTPLYSSAAEDGYKSKKQLKPNLLCFGPPDCVRNQSPRKRASQP